MGSTHVGKGFVTAPYCSVTVVVQNVASPATGIVDPSMIPPCCGGDAAALCCLTMQATSSLRYSVPGFSERWTLPEQPVPESAWHDACVELVRALLVAWLARVPRRALQRIAQLEAELARRGRS